MSSSTPASTPKNAASTPASKNTTTTTSRSNTKVRLTIPIGSEFGASSPAPRSGGYNYHHFSKHNLTRWTDISQMDIQSALDQMRSLVSGRPHVVYKTAYYRKQTKNHWARDDPAFMVLQAAFLVAAALAYAVAFRCSLGTGISFLLHVLLWNWLVPGVVVATIGRELANRQLNNSSQSSSHVQQTVEWLYAFDIHCNAFFPLFCLCYVVHFFLLPLVLGQSLVALLLSNTVFCVGFSWYWYITHLGYRSLPFLSHTELFLFPIAAILLVFLLNVLGYPLGMGWNASRLLAQLYFE